MNQGQAPAYKNKISPILPLRESSFLTCQENKSLALTATEWCLTLTEVSRKIQWKGRTLGIVTAYPPADVEAGQPTPPGGAIGTNLYKLYLQ